jgi:ATP synthase protein I
MWRTALRYSAVGLEMGIAVAIGYGAGWWLDQKLGTGPYLMLLMTVLGVAAGFKGVIQLARRAMREAEKQDDDKPPDGTDK